MQVSIFMNKSENKGNRIGFQKSFKLTVVVAIILLFVGYTLWIDTSDIGLQKIHQPDEIACEGKLLYQKYNCQACHQIYGLGGYMGPDLTNVFTTPGKGPVYISAFLRNGTNRMPNFHLNQHGISALISYLATVDSTGNSSINKYKITWYGSIEFTARSK